jgi:hypothetical protein
VKFFGITRCSVAGCRSAFAGIGMAGERLQAILAPSWWPGSKR